MLRKAQALNLPLAPPHSHPFNPLAPMRASCCALGDVQRLQLIDRLFRATWAEGAPVSEAAMVARLAGECALDGVALIAESQTESVKARLRNNTDEALAAGVFGVPTMLVRGELFWGFDDLEYLEQFLSGRDSLAAERSAYQAWFQIKPSANRLR